jgi:hypothetical protein
MSESLIFSLPKVRQDTRVMGESPQEQLKCKI